MSEAPKHGRGHPKGGKNKPGTTGVGCPRKDRCPPQPRLGHRHSEDSGKLSDTCALRSKQMLTSPLTVSSLLVATVPSTRVPSSVHAGESINASRFFPFDAQHLAQC